MTRRLAVPIIAALAVVLATAVALVARAAVSPYAGMWTTVPVASYQLASLPPEGFLAETPIGYTGALATGHVAYAYPWSAYDSPIQLVPSAALTANASNYATVSVYKRSAGSYGTAVLIAQLTTASTSWSAWTPVPLALQLSNQASFVSGDVLTISVAMTGTGVTIPASLVVVMGGIGGGGTTP